MLVVVLLLGGCFEFGDPPGAGMAIINESDEDLTVQQHDASWTFTALANQARGIPLSGGKGDCTPIRLDARTTDGVEVAHTDDEQCDGDRWTITQAEVDTARAGAGVPSPTLNSATAGP